MKISSSMFETEVLKSDIPVIADFYADWCGPCKMMGPILDEFEQENEGKIKVVKINVDESPDVARKYGIMSIPTLIVFKNGEVTARNTGVIPTGSVAKLVNK